MQNRELTNARIHRHEIIPKQQRGLVISIVRQSKHDQVAHNDRATKPRDDDAFPPPPRGDIGSAEDCDTLDDAIGHIKQSRLELVKPKGADDQWPKRVDTSRRDTDGKHEGEPEPRLDVEDGFAQVLVPPFAGRTAHLIGSQALNSHQTIMIIEKLCLHRGVWHVSQHDEAEDDSCDAEEQENELGMFISFQPISKPCERGHT